MPKNPTETSPVAPEDSVETNASDPSGETPQRLLEFLEATLRAGDLATLDNCCRQPQFRSPELIDLLLERIEALRVDEPLQAKGLAKLGLRLAARLPNAMFARVWNLWSTTCADVGFEDRAEAGRTIASIFDESLRPGRSGQTRGGRKRKGRRRKPGQG